MQQVQVTSPQSMATAVPEEQKPSGTAPVTALPVRVKLVRPTKATMDEGMAPIKLAPFRFINVRAVKRPISVGIVTPVLAVPA